MITEILRKVPSEEPFFYFPCFSNCMQWLGDNGGIRCGPFVPSWLLRRKKRGLNVSPFSVSQINQKIDAYPSVRKKVAYNNLFNASRQAARLSDSLNKLSIAAIWMNELQVWSWTIGGQQIHSLLHFGARAIRRRSVRLVCYEMHLGAGDSRVGDRVMRYRQC